MQKIYYSEDEGVLKEFGSYFTALPGYAVEYGTGSVKVENRGRAVFVRRQKSGDLKATYYVSGEPVAVTSKIRKVWVTETIGKERLEVSFGYTTYMV